MLKGVERQARNKSDEATKEGCGGEGEPRSARRSPVGLRTVVLPYLACGSVESLTSISLGNAVDVGPNEASECEVVRAHGEDGAPPDALSLKRAQVLHQIVPKDPVIEY